MGFESVRTASLPLWLDGPNAQAYEGALGADEDAALSETKGAIKLAWPLPGCIDATDDAALYHAGENRRIIQAPGEAGVRYRDRLTRAPLHWYWGGTNAGLLLPFEPFYHAFRFIPPTEELKRLDPDRDAALIAIQRAKGRVDPLLWSAHTPPNCRFIQVLNNGDVDGYWDGNADWFSRVFWLIDSSFEEPGVWGLDQTWDGFGDWDDGGLWDTTMTLAEATYLRAQIRRNKSPGSYPTTIAIALPGLPEDGFWGSPGEWEDGGNWGEEPTSDPLYITVGHVWGEEAWLGAWGDWPLTDIWPAEDDGLGGWIAFEGDPLQR